MSANPSNSMEIRRAELLEDVAAHVCENARDFGLAEDVAEQLGSSIADFLASHWGGQVISFPKDFYFRLAARDRKILQEWRDENVGFEELAARYSLTDRGLRKIIDRARIRDRNLNQLDMFNADQAGHATRTSPVLSLPRKGA